MMERSDVAALADRMLTALVAAPPAQADAWLLKMTSGSTSGTPLLTVMQHEVYEDTVRYFFGLSRATLSYGALNIRLSFMLSVRKEPASTARVLLMDGRDLTPTHMTLVEDFSPETCVGFPSFVLRACELMDASARQRIKHLHLAGEHLSPALHQTLAELCPEADLRMLYAAAEIGTLSTDGCGYLPPNTYHPRAGVGIEVHEPDETGAGELLVSVHMHGDFSLEQYRLGDIGRVSHEPCRCGATTTVSVMGKKGHDYIKLLGAILRQEEFERVARGLGLFDDYRVEASHVKTPEGLKGHVRLRVYRGARPLADFELETIKTAYTKELFVTRTQTFGNLVAKGIFEPLELEVSEAPFSRKFKDIKMVFR